MPKPRQRVATGLSVEQILSMPVSKIQSYNATGQREIVSRLASAANKRLKNLSKNDISNSARTSIEKSGGKISVKGKSGDELIREFIRARDFLKNKFSSAKEYKKVIKNIQKNETFKGMKEKDVSDIFGMYDNLRNEQPQIVNKINRYELMDKLESYKMGGNNNADAMRKAIKWMKQEINKTQRDYEKLSPKFENMINDIPVRLQGKRHKRTRKTNK